MEMLGSDELRDMLSPDPLDLKDTRPIYNTMKIIEENAVLYMGLNSLSNKTIGSALGELTLADLASTAGAIYNFHEKKSIYLLVDEAGDVLNENGIQLLNKSHGAGLKAFLCAQTIADLEVILGSKARAMQALGNLNNIFALRVNSPEMARYIADSFGKTSARKLSVSHSTSSSSAKAVMEFSGSFAHSISEEEIPLVSPDLLLKLPGLQYFASLAGAQVLKGRIPLILDK